MARTALVTGAADAAAAAAAVLARRGWQVVRDAPGGPSAGRQGIDCYVQMPMEPHARWARDEGLSARVDMLAGVAPRLDDGATVLLAVDDTEPGSGPVSAELLAAMAGVVLEDAGRPDARVVVLPAADLTATS